MLYLDGFLSHYEAYFENKMEEINDLLEQIKDLEGEINDLREYIGEKEIDLEYDCDTDKVDEILAKIKQVKENGTYEDKEALCQEIRELTQGKCDAGY